MLREIKFLCLERSAEDFADMMMDAGGYDQMDLLKMGWLPSILICIVSVGYVMTVFPAF